MLIYNLARIHWRRNRILSTNVIYRLSLMDCAYLHKNINQSHQISTKQLFIDRFFFSISKILHRKKYLNYFFNFFNLNYNTMLFISSKQMFTYVKCQIIKLIIEKHLILCSSKKIIGVHSSCFFLSIHFFHPNGVIRVQGIVCRKIIWE